jgi:hypothetical protein
MSQSKRMHLQRTRRGLFVLALPFFFLGACEPPEGGAEDDSSSVPDVPSRIVAIGDLHGDLEASRTALRLAGAIDSSDQWVGGDLVIVQTGDILDRGDAEPEIIELFQRLKAEAAEVGGAVHVLNGNHELMNSYLDFRYVTEDGFADYGGEVEVDPSDSVLVSLEPAQRGRAVAARPGGPMAKIFSEQTVQVIVGKTIFAHAGILPEHVDMGLENMEADVRAWLLAEAPQPEWIRGDLSPVWNRVYSRDPTLESCRILDSVLDRLDLDRMVVGHTVQEAGITAYCGGRVWCIDVGLAAHYGGVPEVLEIRGDVVRSLR